MTKKEVLTKIKEINEVVSDLYDEIEEVYGDLSERKQELREETYEEATDCVDAALMAVEELESSLLDGFRLLSRLKR